MWEAGADTVAATIAGMRGGTQTAEAAAARAEHQRLAAGAHTTVALAQVGRILAALGCASWSDRARRELRASGETSRRRDPVARDRLTAQELQIAQLAAAGLTNREIGARLYLSHRTIATHL